MTEKKQRSEKLYKQDNKVLFRGLRLSKELVIEMNKVANAYFDGNWSVMIKFCFRWWMHNGRVKKPEVVLADDIPS